MSYGRQLVVYEGCVVLRSCSHTTSRCRVSNVQDYPTIFSPPQLTRRLSSSVAHLLGPPLRVCTVYYEELVRYPKEVAEELFE